MPENIAQSVQKAIQDLVAPDLRELKVVVAALQKQIDQRFEQVDRRFDAQSKEMNQRFEAQSKEMNQRFEAQSRDSDAKFKALMSAIGEFKAQSELASVRVIAALSERVAVLEARRQ